MPSPFPGMNPYLEHDDAWHDFHQRFIPAVADYLGPLVGRDYIVKIDVNLYVHELSSEERGFLGRPDLSLARTQPSSAAGAGSAVLEAPMQVHIPAVDTETQ